MGSKVPTDPNLSPELQRFLDAQSRGADDASSRLDTVEAEIAALPALASQSEAETGTDNVKRMSPLRTAQAIAAQSPHAAFTKSYTSAQQTITAAGSLTLAHGLGAQPYLLALFLVCTSAEQNYTVGDYVAVHIAVDANTSVGVGIVPDATNLNIRFGSGANTFSVVNKTTGTTSLLTNANWKAVFCAWA